jgi:hypothetical protein
VAMEIWLAGLETFASASVVEPMVIDMGVPP